MTRLYPFIAATMCVVFANCAQSQSPQTIYKTAPCKVAARIDGVDAPGEWDSAARYPVELKMAGVKGDARPVRSAEMRLMSSSVNLYLALRVPDASREASMSPVLIDMAVVSFCKGGELVNGDDKRVVIPSLWADKHFVALGRDADDSRRDGEAAMRWVSKPGGGEYFIEMRIPLNSGDPNDISAKPGGKIKFNLDYFDKFSADLANTEMGGLYGVDMDHAKDWGEMQLADDAGVEAPAPVPDWLARLFPNTSNPDHLAHRLKRIDANDLDVNGKMGGVVNVEFVYPGLDGRDETGEARIFLPPSLRDDPNGKAPWIHNAGYEIDDASAAALLAKGYFVSTPHANPFNPLGRGVNLDRAILHAVRQLPCVDQLHSSIQGGSAGGWMTLMLAADAFPIVWAMPDVPPIHWGYNAAYIDEHAQMAGPAPGSDKPRLPVLAVVVPIAEQAHAFYGMPFDSPSYLAVSPLDHLDTITAPSLLLFSTADILVPIDQVDKSLVEPIDAKLFPEGFSTAMSDRFPGVHGKRTLLTALSKDRYELFKIPLPSDIPRVKTGETPPNGMKPVVLPFSTNKLISVVVVDEGPVEPEDGHTKYVWGSDHEPFRLWAEKRGVTPDQLTAPKLERLMMRLLGEPWRPLRTKPGGKGNEIAGNQLDYAEAETADVMTCLRAFASEDACALRLEKLYSALPSRLKALGPSLGGAEPASVRAKLDELMSSKR